MPVIQPKLEPKQNGLGCPPRHNLGHLGDAYEARWLTLLAFCGRMSQHVTQRIVVSLARHIDATAEAAVRRPARVAPQTAVAHLEGPPAAKRKIVPAALNQHL